MLTVAAILVTTLGKPERESRNVLEQLLHQTEDDDRHPFDRLAAVHRQIGDEITDLRKLARLPEEHTGRLLKGTQRRERD